MLARLRPKDIQAQGGITGKCRNWHSRLVGMQARRAAN